MRGIIIFLFCLLSLYQCKSRIYYSSSVSKERVSEIDKEEEGKWELVVLDPQFTSFVMSQPSPSYYSESFLISKNRVYVREWNTRYSQPFRYDPKIYEVNIEYDPNEKYGVDFEYKMYMFFRFIEEIHKIRLQ